MASIGSTPSVLAARVFLSPQETHDQRAWHDLSLQCQQVEKYIALGVYDTAITLTDLLKYSQWLANGEKSTQKSCWSKTLLISLNVLRSVFSDIWTEMYNALNRDGLYPLLGEIESDWHTRRALHQKLTELSISQAKMRPLWDLPNIDSEYKHANLDEVTVLLTNYLSFFEWMETTLVPDVNRLFIIWLNQQRDQLMTNAISASTALVNKRLLNSATLEHCDALLRLSDNPDHICPITHAIMVDPMKIEPCGHCFENDAIVNWKAQSATCPVDRRAITRLVADPTLKQEIGRSVFHLLSLENITAVNKTLKLLEEQKRLLQDPRFLACYPLVFEQIPSDGSPQDLTSLYPQEKDYQCNIDDSSECRILIFDEFWRKYTDSKGGKFTEDTKEHAIYKVARLELSVECAFIKAIRQAARHISLGKVKTILGAYRTVEGAESMNPETLTKVLMRAVDSSGFNVAKDYTDYIQKQLDQGVNPFKTAPDFVYIPERSRRPDDIFSTFQQGKLPAVRHVHFINRYPNLNHFLEAFHTKSAADGEHLAKRARTESRAE